MPNVPCFALEGNITLDNVPILTAKIENFLTSTVEERVKVQFDQVQKVDSSAIALLLALLRFARPAHKTLIFCNPPAALEALVDLYGLNSVLTFVHERH